MPDEKWKTARMIDVRMRQYDGIDCLDRHRESQVLRMTFTTLPLKQTAVENDRLLRDSKYVTRTGNLLCGADEFDFHDSLEEGMLAGSVRVRRSARSRSA